MDNMKFNKPHKSVKEQAELLKTRGLEIKDTALAEHYLLHLNYYRFAGYCLPFEQSHSPQTFLAATHFEDVLNLYTFDRELRLLLMDAIERIEISMRTQWAYHFTKYYGSHAYLDPSLSKKTSWHVINLKILLEELKRTDEKFIEHYQATYSIPPTPPTWVVCEVMSLGLLSRWFTALKPSEVRADICRTYGLPDPVLTSFIDHLSYIRNLCAHHSRTWNRRVTKTMQIPHVKYKNLIITDSFNRDSKAERKIYNTLVMIAYLLDVISPKHHWKSRLKNLIENHTINVEMMGFPNNWLKRSIWSS